MVGVETFKFAGGSLCLDFVNTLEWVDGAVDVEWLESVEGLLLWSRLAGLIQLDELGRMIERAHQHPQRAVAALDEIKGLRSLLYRIFTALSEQRQPDAADLERLNELAQIAQTWRRLLPTATGFAWAWLKPDDDLTWLGWPLLQSALDLLTSPALKQLRHCASPDCSWLFLDTSRNHSRRWCDMEDCGNRAKARRHYARARSMG